MFVKKNLTMANCMKKVMVALSGSNVYFLLIITTIMFFTTSVILIIKAHENNTSEVAFINVTPKMEQNLASREEKVDPPARSERAVEAVEQKSLTPEGESIFIAMPAFDERDCANTILSAYSGALFPDRVFFGVYQQTGDNTYDCTEFKDLNCPEHPICTRMWQIRINRVPINAENSKGPTHARAMAMQHYKNEDFIFVTDSHTRFRKDWDKLVVQYWRMTGNENAILTHYPKGIDTMKHNVEGWTNPHRPNPPAYGICGTYFEMPPNWMPRNANGCYIHGAKSPILTPFWCAGFSFMPKKANNDVPWDPYTEYMFWGEEFSYGSRLWTAGYDFYVPHQDIAFHRYSPDKEHSRGTINKVWRKDTGKVRDRSEKRINYLWGMLDVRTPGWKEEDINLVEIQKYGMGNKRSLEAYWKFAGINLKERTFKIFTKEEYREGLKIVPFDPLLGLAENNVKRLSNRREKYRPIPKKEDNLTPGDVVPEKRIRKSNPIPRKEGRSSLGDMMSKKLARRLPNKVP